MSAWWGARGEQGESIKAKGEKKSGDDFVNRSFGEGGLTLFSSPAFAGFSLKLRNISALYIVFDKYC